MDSAFSVRGRKLEPHEAAREEIHELFAASDEFAYEIIAEVAVGRTARGTAEIVELDGDDDDVIEIEDDQGFVSFHRAGTLAEARGPAARGYDLLSLFADAAARDGLGQIATVRRGKVSLPADVQDALQQLKESLADMNPLGMARDFVLQKGIEAATRKAMQVIVGWIDSPAPADAPEDKKRKRPKPPGVYRVGGDLLLHPGQLGAIPDSGEPHLLLLHGTFSHTEAAFGGLRNTTAWNRLVDHYDGRVLALEHPTLGATPVQNALAAARVLPGGSRLHLVSHSRGGLVGEALSYTAAQKPNLKFLRAAKHPDTAHLAELYDLISDKGIRVERFVRVACPARGTTLASRRLDQYANYLFNVFKLVPFLRATGIAGVIKQLLLTFLDQRTDPSIVPGLEAQMPTSALVQTLNTAATSDDGLAVIAGDIQGSGIGKRIAVAAADLFYREDHDLVVNTSAMYAGLPRTKASRAFYKGAKVHHSAYFTNEDSRAALLAWLTNGDSAAAGFEDFAVGRPRGARRRPPARGDGAGPTERVVVVPDVFGSILSRANRDLWPEVAQLARAGLADVLNPETAAKASGLAESYDRLIDRLSERYAVEEFDYDWRLPVTNISDALLDRIAAKGANGKPVHLVAHGAGSLVALHAAAQPGWSQASTDRSRIVLLGPPLGGAWSVVARLLGRDELTQALAMIDPAFTAPDVGRLLSRIPLLVAMLPWDVADDGWAQLGDAAPLAADLVQARQIRDSITATSTKDVIALVGRGVTIDGKPAAGGFDFFLTDGGDGVSTYGRLSGHAIARRYIPIPHGQLARSEVVASTVDELLGGATPTTLMAMPPEAGESSPLPDLTNRLLFPTSEELLDSALGGSYGPPEAAERPLRLSVVHGDLTYLDSPLIVGTYDGTPLDGAERALDGVLGGALTRRAALAQFPGPVGTYDVIVPEEGTGLWAVVVGMGDSGAVTAAGLSAGVTAAVLKTAALVLDRASNTTDQNALTLNSVLMGTSGTGALPIPSSIAAIVEGVVRANRKLAADNYRVHVEQLRFIELFEERAVVAVHAIQEIHEQVKGGGRQAAQIVVDQHLTAGCAGLPGRPDMGYDEGEWVTIRVQARRPESEILELTYTTVGRRARAEQRLSSGQASLITDLIRSSIDNPTVDPQLYNTLYELITPVSMKAPGREWDNVMYVLDEAASELPLEMLAMRAGEFAEAAQPLATTVGMVRRLETSTFRERVRPAAGSMALVIGDPPTKGFVRLPGARMEARRVADLLRSRGFDVVELISKDDADESVDPTRIFNALFANDYRIVHIAAHGNFDEESSKNGVVLGQDIYLTAAEVEKMQTTPDLVFLNCCHIGSMVPAPGSERSAPEWRPDRLTASISRQLIDNGVLMSIGAAWAVNDHSAADFAEAFYTAMLDGADFGTASKVARLQIWHDYAHRADNTWGAYQVYGPPAAALEVRQSARRDRAVRSAREYRDRLQTLSRRAADAQPDVAAGIADTARTLIADAPAEWGGGESDYLAGMLWLECADYPTAVECLDRAVNRWGADAPMKAYEQLVNARTKWAVALAKEQKRRSNAELRLALKMIEGLIEMGETPERLALLGSYWRRRMLIAADDDQRKDAATKASKAYEKAGEIHQEETGAPDFYAELNRLSLEGVRRMHGRKRAPTADETALIEACRASSAAAACPDFWTRATEGDALLAGHLLARTLASNASTVQTAYEAAFASSSPRHRKAIVEHLRILASGLPTKSSGAPKAEREALDTIASNLETWGSADPT